MRFLADECCDAGLVEALRADDHDVLYAQESLRGGVDDDILAMAYSQDRILLTEDKDFGELVYRLGQPTRGIILLRFAISERHLKLPRLRDLIAERSWQLPGAFVVVEPDKFRVRPLTIRQE
jgi:predicted nuclease of predicted toxin-antitoxin system